MEGKGRQRAWDAYDAYLFDIDGTLLQCTDAVHYFAFCETLTWLAERPLNLDGVTAHGNTDVGILRDALKLAGVPDAEWRPKLREAKDAMGAFVERNRGDLRVEALPFVAGTLRHLRERGAVLGVATGNLERIGKLKLEACGLLNEFRFGGYSDEFEYRSEVFCGALRKVEGFVSREAAVCVVGDTPADVQAAKANGVDVIAVATGVHSEEELAREEPTYCVRTLGELLVGR